MKSRPLMTLEEMTAAGGGQRDGECPSDALHEPEAKGFLAYDDITGQDLDPGLMIKAHRLLPANGSL